MLRLLSLFTLLFFSCQNTADFNLKITPIPLPIAQNCMFPNLTSTANDDLLLSWIYEPDSITYLQTAQYKNGKWKEIQTAAQGTDWFVNWADFPAISQQADGTVLTHFLPKNSDETYGYDVAIIRSTNDGKEKLPPITPHRDSTATEHGFVSCFNVEKDKTGIVWLDGRNYAKAKNEAAHGHDHGGTEAEMTLRFATINTAGKIADAAEIDPRVCSCCQTDAANFLDGTIVVYRDRSEKEIRDISYLIYQNGQWSQPQAVHHDGWQIAGCPVNGPAVAASDQQIAVAWYTEADDNPRVLLSVSDDIKNGFGAPIQMNEQPTIGRVDVQFIDDNQLLVSYLEKENEQAFLKIKRLNTDLEVLETISVAPYDAARSSGFPRMTRSTDGVYLAWTEAGEVPQIKLVKLTLTSK